MNHFISFFVPHKKDENQTQYNFRVGNFASFFGLLVNITLFGLKLFIGLVSSSMAIIADAINNLSDSFSSCIVIASFYISKKPADKQHPFGHARIEYLFSSVVALIIVMVGLQLFYQSIVKIKAPTTPVYSIYAVIILAVSISAKWFLAAFYRCAAQMINSPLLEATGADSRSDVLSTAVILVSIPVYHCTGFSVDAYLSLIVSILVVRSGFKVLRHTIDRMLGTAPTPEEINLIRNFILKHEGIEGVHDLIVHDYGTAHRFVSCHAEVDAAVPILESHALIDRIESEAVSEIGIQLLLHMDPVVKNDPELNTARRKTQEALLSAGLNFEIHDFRLVHSYKTINVIFDVNVPCENRLSDKEISDAISEHLKKIAPQYNPVITIDRSYIRSSSIGSIK